MLQLLYIRLLFCTQNSGAHLIDCAKIHILFGAHLLELACDVLTEQMIIKAVVFPLCFQGQKIKQHNHKGTMTQKGVLLRQFRAGELFSAIQNLL